MLALSRTGGEPASKPPKYDPTCVDLAAGLESVRLLRSSRPQKLFTRRDMREAVYDGRHVWAHGTAADDFFHLLEILFWILGRMNHDQQARNFDDFLRAVQQNDDGREEMIVLELFRQEVAAAYFESTSSCKAIFMLILSDIYEHAMKGFDGVVSKAQRDQADEEELHRRLWCHGVNSGPTAAKALNKINKLNLGIMNFAANLARTHPNHDFYEDELPCPSQHMVPQTTAANLEQTDVEDAMFFLRDKHFQIEGMFYEIADIQQKVTSYSEGFRKLDGYQDMVKRFKEQEDQFKEQSNLLSGLDSLQDSIHLSYVITKQYAQLRRNQERRIEGMKHEIGLLKKATDALSSARFDDSEGQESDDGYVGVMLHEDERTQQEGGVPVATNYVNIGHSELVAMRTEIKQLRTMVDQMAPLTNAIRYELTHPDGAWCEAMDQLPVEGGWISLPASVNRPGKTAKYQGKSVGERKEPAVVEGGENGLAS